MKLLAATGVLLLTLTSILPADEPAASNVPNRVPLTRPEMKQALEDLKQRSTRIPVPSLSEEEQAKLGDQADKFEARLRLRYLPHEFQGKWSRDNDPNMSLTYEFKTMMFWIVARANNCHY